MGMFILLGYHNFNFLVVFFCFYFFKLGIGLEDDLKVGGRDGGDICFNKEFGLLYFFK